MHVRDPVGVGGGSEPAQLGEDVRSACFGVLERLHDDDARAFAHHESVP